MKPMAIVAAGAISALGEGEAAVAIGRASELPITAVREDEILRAAGLARPFLARAPGTAGAPEDPAALLIERATTLLVESLDGARPGWRSSRVGLALGTSSGGMVSLTRALALRAGGRPIPEEVARGAPYFGPLGGVDRALGIAPRERTQVLAACASSGIAVGIACRWLELGHVDLVLAGGYDAVSVLVAAGFESLGATSTRPSPFRTGRSGMALGEAAALVALVRADDARGPALGFVRGFGASADAVHVTAPDRTGAGLARAAESALRDAGCAPDGIDLVSAHGTATPFNDAAEARALGLTLGERAASVPVHPWKAVVGHTLGASSALELLAALSAMKQSIAPGAVGEGPIDPEARVHLLERNEAAELRTCLKLSAAFGGANAALVAGLDAGPGRPLAAGPVSLIAEGPARTASDLLALADVLRIPKVQVTRMDRLSAASVAAAHDVLRAAPELSRERMGVVVGTSTASLENDEEFDARLRERGPGGVEPRRFPPTSPNLAPGQCSIAFGLLGPSLAVGAGPDAALEALIVGHDLVAAGDAESMIVVLAEDVGDAVRDIWRAAGWAVPVAGARAWLLSRGPSRVVDRARLGLLRAQRLEAGDPSPPSAGDLLTPIH